MLCTFFLQMLFAENKLTPEVFCYFVTDCLNCVFMIFEDLSVMPSEISKHW